MASPKDFARFDDRQTRKFLTKVTRKVLQIEKGANKYVTEISPIAFKDVLDHFAKEMGPSGRWKPWSDSYREQLSRLGRSGNNILIDNGFLRQQTKPALFGSSSSRGEIILLINNAKTKSGFPYAFAHDNDTEPRKQLPQRKFMWLSVKAQQQIARQTLTFLGVN